MAGKTKKAAGSKSKTAAGKKTKSNKGKVDSKTAKRSGAAIGSKAKKAPEKAVKKVVKKPVAATEILAHGADLHLIPVRGEIHPAGSNEAKLTENRFRHNEEIALHQEQQKIRAALAVRNSAKRIIRQPRQS